MVTVGFLIQFEAKPGKEADVEQELKKALAVVQKEPATIAWFAARMGHSKYVVFDVFPDEEGRQAHFNANAAALQAAGSELFVEGSLVLERVDILAAKLPE
ncbi:hypothetical protein KDA_73920 [Dictyobacter alpinus]|uniref:ABM domain-containing protein n=1 Tax=Dictyobacter alpinus TaxID=2014873 RepID=A0A402BKL8_9CHLR|nr:antibiotic biosynthesis monooxygenase [Dictyobacter alpinus]GCE31908.1 hypothetical protein KDA_73920 [Dictyobacter alpinus]